MRIALYARVSTKDQDQNPETQLIRLREYAERLPCEDGFHALSEFVDYTSGTKLYREQLDQLMDACRAGQFDMVIAQRIDRFGRSLVHLLKLLDELQLRPWCALGYFDLGGLYADTGQKDKALKALKKAEAEFRDMGMDYHLRRTQEVLARVKT